MNNTDQISHGVSRLAVDEVLYGSPPTVQKTQFSDEVLENVKNVTEVVKKIETGELKPTKTTSVRRRSTTLQNLPSLSERIARMRCNKVEPLKESISPIMQSPIATPQHNQHKASTDAEEKVETPILTPMKDKELTDATSPQQIPKEMNSFDEVDYTKSTATNVTVIRNYHIQSPEAIVETPILSQVKRSPIRNTEDFSVLFDASNGRDVKLHETPILTSRSKPMKNKGISRRALDFENTLKTPQKEFCHENFQDCHETPILRTLSHQTSGADIINRIESETNMALSVHDEKHASDTDSSRSSSAYSSAMDSEPGSTDSKSSKNLEEFTYSKLARAQLHRKFEQYHSWDIDVLRSVASSVAEIRLKTLENAEANDKVTIVRDIYQKCTGQANKELYALVCSLFFLCEVLLPELTSAEEYCAEKYKRRQAQRDQ